MCDEPNDEAPKKHSPKKHSGTWQDRNYKGEWPRTPGRLIGIGFIKAYQFLLSPILGKSCRHLPTCSEFGYEAIARHGLMAGGWLTFWRVLKCNPLTKAGLDPVPQKMRWKI